MSRINVKALPVVNRATSDLETLEAEFAMANKRVAQAVRRRDEIMDSLKTLLRAKAISELEKRGIQMGKTIVIVSQRSWLSDEWEYKKCIVMDIHIEERWARDEDTFDPALIEPVIRYEFAAVRKDGNPSKAHSGIHHDATIERIA